MLGIAAPQGEPGKEERERQHAEQQPHCQAARLLVESDRHFGEMQPFPNVRNGWKAASWRHQAADLLRIVDQRPKRALGTFGRSHHLGRFWVRQEAYVRFAIDCQFDASGQ